MKRWTFLMLIMIVLWIWMIIRTFFWWTEKENSNIIPQQSTWFIEELTSSWASDIPSTIQLNNNTSKEYAEIKVMMPKYFYNSGWKKFAEDLYSWQKVFINFIFIDNINRYRDILSTEFSIFTVNKIKTLPS